MIPSLEIAMVKAESMLKAQIAQQDLHAAEKAAVARVLVSKMGA